MIKEERLKGNRLIGTFVGKSFSMSHISDYEGVSDDALPTMKYHSNYQWLMKGWQRFRDLRFENVAHQLEHSNFKTNIAYCICYRDIESAFQSIVSAIQWYNSLNLTHEQESY